MYYFCWQDGFTNLVGEVVGIDVFIVFFSFIHSGGSTKSMYMNGRVGDDALLSR